MRDYIVLALVMLGALSSLRHPWVGVMLWTWISMLNPHRFSYGVAYSAPVAAVAAAVTLIGLVATKDRRSSPFKGAPVTVFAIFAVWITISWLLGIDPSDDYAQWSKVMKVFFMIFVALAVLHSKKHIIALIWVAAGSLAVLGVKGGVFTVLNGGSFRVYGPPGTFIEDNNEFAVALIMTIPLLRFLQMQLSNTWGKRALGLAMLLCTFAALGSQSRGALLALSSMGALFWLRGNNKVRNGLLIGSLALALLAFMPDTWFERMQTIETYDKDRSAMGRISAWWVAWNLARDYPFGVGFNAVRPELFGKYSPYPDLIQAAHSIYFQILGHHGYVGLILFVVLLLLCWSNASWLRSRAPRRPETQWCIDLGNMCQACLLGFFVGGAFLSLAYFDLPYNIMIILVLAKAWCNEKGWEHDPPEHGRWRVPGAAPTLSAPPR